MSTLIRNERTKLLANALDRASTACGTVGVLAPIAAFIYNISYNVSPVPPLIWLVFAGAVFWLSTAVALHFVARAVLKGLVS